jgi:alpha-L-arabinofuranosidase
MKPRSPLSVLVVAGLLLAQTLPASAQVDQSIYTDSLLNGWQNWSWATVNLANHTPVRSGSSSISVASGPWQALSLHHDAFNTSSYTNLVFWINGGSGGQRLQVFGTINGAAQAASVPLGPLTANTWQQIVIPLASIGIAATNSDGFWIQEYTGTNAATYYVDDITLTAVPVPAAVNIAVNAASAVRTVDARHFAQIGRASCRERV